MTSDRTLAAMRLADVIRKPNDTYWRAVRRAGQTATDSPENLAAIERGEAALREIEAAVRAWVAEHPAP